MGVFLDKMFSLFAGQKQPERVEKAPRIVRDHHKEGAEGPYGDYAFIRTRIKNKVEDIAKVRWQFERLWFHCVMYQIGNQWVRWDDQRREWRQRNLKRKWVPKPVTNRFASTLSSIRGVISQSKVEPSAWPASDQAMDIAAAEIADQIIPVINDEIGVDKLRTLIAGWEVLCADAFAMPYYDMSDDSLGRTPIQSEKCMVCGHVAQPLDFEQGCGQCGTPSLTEPAFDEAGKPITESYPIGRMRVDVLSPLETYFRLDVREIRDLREFTRLRIYTKESVEARWPEMGKRASSSLQTQTKQAINYLRMIAYMTQNSAVSAGRSEGDVLGLFTHFEMPSDDFPEGLCCVMADDETILEVGPTPAFEETPSAGKRFYLPLVQFGYDDVPGRVYHKSPAFDLLSKQDQRNRLESLMELSVMKGVYNSWLLPTGSSITRLSGEPAQLIRWTPSGTNGAKPEVITTDPFTQSVLQWLEKIDSDFEEIGGTFDAMKGQAPKGVSAGYALQLLTEKAYGRFTEPLVNWNASWIELYKMLLCIFRANVTEARISRIKSDAGSWQMKQFKGADLAGSVDLRIEGGAEKPRTKLAEQAIVESMIKMGVLNPQVDPIMQYKIAAKFGVGDLVGQQAEDFRYAAKEWDMFTTQQIAPVLLPDVDNDVIHLSDHLSRAKSDKFSELDPTLMQVWLQHIRDHSNNIIRKQMLQMQGGTGEQPAPEGKGKQAPLKPVDSKGRENQDGTMNQVREGGSSAMGSTGENQHA